METASKLLALAAAQLGTKESPAGSNRVKYNTAYYGREVSGSAYPWCCVFIWWLFREAGASELFYGGGKTASCTTLYNWHKKKGQAVPAGNARPGDLVFFNFDGDPGVMNHIGICESCAGGYVTTIDGNTGTTNEANGGAVMRRTRALGYVGGVVRPNYESGEIDLTKDEVQALVERAVEAARPKVYTDMSQVPLWAQGLVGRAWAAGIIKGDEAGRLNLTSQDLKTLSMLDGAGLIKGVG